MEKITSFTIDHLRLIPGLYVSRIDRVEGHPVTTFDIRITNPNEEPVMNTAEVHTIEHLAATFLRNHKTYADKTIYFGPMGCRTGFYLLLDSRQVSDAQAVELVKEVFAAGAAYDGEMPGKSARECGNYINLDVETGRAVCGFYGDLIADWTAERLSYD